MSMVLKHGFIVYATNFVNLSIVVQKLLHLNCSSTASGGGMRKWQSCAPFGSFIIYKCYINAKSPEVGSDHVIQTATRVSLHFSAHNTESQPCVTSFFGSSRTKVETGPQSVLVMVAGFSESVI